MDPRSHLSVSTEFRYDRATIQPEWEETPEGYLRIRATFARSGCQRYRRMDGSEVVEFRPEEEVAAEKALLSLANLPVTLEHPPELLTPDTARQHTRGFTGSHVEYKSPFASGVVTITDREAIEAIKRGDSREVSVGYRVEFDPTPGVAPDGQRFDGIQRSISGNHLAITREARGGRELRLHMDSAEAVERIDASTSTPIPENDMTTAVAALSSATDALAAALKAQTRQDMDDPKPKGAHEGDEEEPEGEGEGEGEQEKEDGCGGRKDSAPVSAAEHQRVVAALAQSRADHQRDLGRIDALVTRLDSLEQELETRQDAAASIDLGALVGARIELLEKAKAIGGDEFRADAGASDRDIMLAALKAAGADAGRFDSLSDDYLRGQFEAYAEAPVARVDSARQLADALRGARSDSPDDPIEAARQRCAAETREAHKHLGGSQDS